MTIPMIINYSYHDSYLYVLSELVVFVANILNDMRDSCRPSGKNSPNQDAANFATFKLLIFEKRLYL